MATAVQMVEGGATSEVVHVPYLTDAEPVSEASQRWPVTWMRARCPSSVILAKIHETVLAVQYGRVDDGGQESALSVERQVWRWGSSETGFVLLAVAEEGLVVELLVVLSAVGKT